MSVDDYEYWGLLAAAWDVMRGDPAAFTDRQYYRDIVSSGGGPALDVGCGTGRLLLEFVADGLDVDGVDHSPEMLALCRAKAAELGLTIAVYEQGMEALDLPRRYKTIFVPSYSFQLAPDLGDARSALAGFYRHLLPGGMLVLSIWHILNEGTGEWGDWWQVVEVQDYKDGRDLRRWERSRYDAQTELRHTESRYELLEDGEVVYVENHSRSPELRNYSVAQITAMLREAGFEDVTALAGYSDEPAGEEDSVVHVLGRKAGD